MNQVGSNDKGDMVSIIIILRVLCYIMNVAVVLLRRACAMREVAAGPGMHCYRYNALYADVKTFHKSLGGLALACQ